jgi:hypothetical protein
MPYLETRRALIGIALALAMATPAHAIYKWVDEKGVTHFSEHPPPDGKKAQKIEPKVTPPSSDAKAADWKQREQEQRKKRIEQDQKDEHRKASSQNAAAERQNRCVFARRELHVLEKQIPVYHLDEKGDKVYLEDKDRPAQVARYKQAVAEYCD